MVHVPFAEGATQACGPKRLVLSVVDEAQVGHPSQPGLEPTEGTPFGPAAAIWTCARRQKQRHVEVLLQCGAPPEYHCSQTITAHASPGNHSGMRFYNKYHEHRLFY
jgi:hypothetical protein